MEVWKKAKALLNGEIVNISPITITSMSTGMKDVVQLNSLNTFNPNSAPLFYEIQGIIDSSEMKIDFNSVGNKKYYLLEVEE